MLSMPVLLEKSETPETLETPGGFSWCGYFSRFEGFSRLEGISRLERLGVVVTAAHFVASMATRSAAIPREPYALTEPRETPRVSAT
jgi:hypothetical protein